MVITQRYAIDNPFGLSADTYTHSSLIANLWPSGLVVGWLIIALRVGNMLSPTLFHEHRGYGLRDDDHVPDVKLRKIDAV
jgi:hypothetical protein